MIPKCNTCNRFPLSYTSISNQKSTYAFLEHLKPSGYKAPLSPSMALFLVFTPNHFPSLWMALLSTQWFKPEIPKSFLIPFSPVYPYPTSSPTILCHWIPGSSLPYKPQFNVTFSERSSLYTLSSNIYLISFIFSITICTVIYLLVYHFSCFSYYAT
jgi:hypothetical protein